MTACSVTILIVEDDTDNIRLYQSMLRQSSVKIVCISSQDLSCLGEIMAQVQPRLLIFDFYSMRSHYDCTLKLLALLPDVTTAIITTSPDNGCNANFDYVISKPFVAENLYHIVAQVL